MFLSRLDEARNEIAQAQPKDIQIRSEKGTNKINETKRSSGNGSNITNISKLELEINKISTSKNKKLIFDLSEYLFDLFDANMMEEFHQIELLESNAMEYFSGCEIGCEYTHKQYELHGEFVKLFEILIEKFLHEQHCSMDELCEVLNNYVNQVNTSNYFNEFDMIDDDASCKESNINNPNNSRYLAKEVIDVISVYTNFEMWSSMMKEQASQKVKYQNFHSRLEDALSSN
eukprot:gene7358-10028_t